MSEKWQWTEERLAELRKLYPTALSATEIAARIGAPSKSAVIGAAHRLGLLKPQKSDGSTYSISWPAQREEELRRLFLDGNSQRQIAYAMGISKSAVGSKMARMGLRHMDAPPSVKARKPRHNPFAAVNIQRKREALKGEDYKDVAVVPLVPTSARLWTERRFGECAYPVGGEGADTLSCCLPTDGATYCKGHHAIMFAPSKANERLKRGADRFAEFMAKRAA